jgi:hypothetical protein
MFLCFQNDNLLETIGLDFNPSTHKKAPDSKSFLVQKSRISFFFTDFFCIRVRIDFVT